MAVLESLQTLARRCVAEALRVMAGRGPVLLVDGTAGNGVDTEFLARQAQGMGLVQSPQPLASHTIGADSAKTAGTVSASAPVVAFDVQEEAIRRTQERLEKYRLGHMVRLVLDSHAELETYLPVGVKLGAAMYNLGYLPGGDASVTTLPKTSMASILAVSQRLCPGGIISIYCYTGQEHGEAELHDIEAWAENLPWEKWRVTRYAFCNKPVNKEVLFLAWRL